MLKIITIAAGLLLGFLFAPAAMANDGYSHRNVGDVITVQSYCAEAKAREFLEFWRAEEDVTELWRNALAAGDCFEFYGQFSVSITEVIGPLPYNEDRVFFLYGIGERTDGTKWFVVHVYPRLGQNI